MPQDVMEAEKVCPCASGLWPFFPFLFFPFFLFPQIQASRIVIQREAGGLEGATTPGSSFISECTAIDLPSGLLAPFSPSFLFPRSCISPQVETGSEFFPTVHCRLGVARRSGSIARRPGEGGFFSFFFFFFFSFSPPPLCDAGHLIPWRDFSRIGLSHLSAFAGTICNIHRPRRRHSPFFPLFFFFFSCFTGCLRVETLRFRSDGATTYPVIIQVAVDLAAPSCWLCIPFLFFSLSSFPFSSGSVRDQFNSIVELSRLSGNSSIVILRPCCCETRSPLFFL